MDVLPPYSLLVSNRFIVARSGGYTTVVDIASRRVYGFLVTGHSSGIRYGRPPRNILSIAREVASKAKLVEVDAVALENALNALATVAALHAITSKPGSGRKITCYLDDVDNKYECGTECFVYKTGKYVDCGLERLLEIFNDFLENPPDRIPDRIPLEWRLRTKVSPLYMYTYWRYPSIVLAISVRPSMVESERNIRRYLHIVLKDLESLKLEKPLLVVFKGMDKTQLHIKVYLEIIDMIDSGLETVEYAVERVTSVVRDMEHLKRLLLAAELAT